MGLLDETVVPLNEAAKTLPGRPHASTVHRWRSVGVRGGIRLEALLVGGKWMTSVEAIRRFFLAATAAANHQQEKYNDPDEHPRPDPQLDRKLDASGL